MEEIWILKLTFISHFQVAIYSQYERRYIMFLKKIYVFILTGLFFIIFLTSKALAAEDLEVDKLKQELKILKQQVIILQQKINELENKRIKEITKKTMNQDEKITKLEKKVNKLDKVGDTLKQLQEKTRVKLSGEIRFRFDSTIADTPANFVYPGQPKRGKHPVDWCSWPMRFRFQFESKVIPDHLDLYGRLTINKRFGKIMYFGTGSNPHDWYNAYAAHQGGDTTPRLENLYVIAKPPYFSKKLPIKLWFGRLPGYEGPPTRARNTIFPRLFVDSEIEGGLINLELPEFPFEKKLTKIQHKFLGGPPEPTKTEKERKFSKIGRSKYFKKLKAKNELYIGYLKYADVGLTGPGGHFDDLLGINKGPDSNCFISQLQLKLTKDTQIFFNYAYMHSYYMPRYSFYITQGHNFRWDEAYVDELGNQLVIPYIKPKPYHLGGIWLDTQIWRFQVYGAYYWSHFAIAPHKHRWTFSEEGWAALQEQGINPEDYGYEKVGERTYEKKFKGDNYPGHAWFIGFNTGNLIHDKIVLWVDMTRGSKYWINPFNCKGYRRKGTVHYLSNNYFYNPNFSNDTIVAGYFPFSARVLDVCLTYYFHPRTYLLLGTMYFNFDAPRKRAEDFILGCSGRKSYWYPHIEWKIFF